MVVLIRVLTFVLFYVLASKGAWLLGVGPTFQLVAGVVAGFFAAVAIGDRVANSRRKSAPGAAKPERWEP
jgi:hypothetical protein